MDTMGLAWNPWAIPGLVAPPIVAALAWTVYRARPRDSQNRFLALFLWLTALSVLSGHGLRFFATEERTAFAFYVAYLASTCVGNGLLLLFLGTLRVPWLSWLRLPWVRVAVIAASVAFGLVIVLRSDVIATSMTYRPQMSVWTGNLDGSLAPLYLSSALFVYLLAIPAAIHAAKRARNEVERAKAWALARAFIVLGVTTAAFYLWALIFLVGKTKLSLPQLMANFYSLAAASFVTSILLAYGILQAQLFDIDVKLKWTVKRGTLAGIFIAVFFVASQVAQNYLSNTGGLWVGGVVTGLVLFAISPLQHFAERLSTAAVPGAAAMAVEARKTEIFRAALEGAMEDGAVTRRERAMLEHLQRELGISNSDAKVMETAIRRP